MTLVTMNEAKPHSSGRQTETLFHFRLARVIRAFFFHNSLAEIVSLRQNFINSILMETINVLAALWHDNAAPGIPRTAIALNQVQ